MNEGKKPQLNVPFYISSFIEILFLSWGSQGILKRGECGNQESCVGVVDTIQESGVLVVSLGEYILSTLVKVRW